MEEIFEKPEVSDLVNEYVALAPKAARFAVIEQTLKTWFGETAGIGTHTDGRIQIEISFSKKVKIKMIEEG